MAKQRKWADGTPIPNELFENEPLLETQQEVGRIRKRDFDEMMRAAGVPATVGEIRSGPQVPLAEKLDGSAKIFWQPDRKELRLYALPAKAGETWDTLEILPADISNKRVWHLVDEDLTAKINMMHKTNFLIGG